MPATSSARLLAWLDKLEAAVRERRKVA